MNQADTPAGRAPNPGASKAPEGPSAATSRPAKAHAFRLSVILTELSESHGPAGEASAPGSAAPAGKASKSDLTVGEVIDRTAHAGFGFMIAFLALLSLPAVGASTPFGLAIAFGAVQMLLGRRRPWLPKAVRRYHVSLRTLGWIGGKLTRWTRGFERVIRPRLVALAHGPFWGLCAVCILLHAIALALPIPIPGTNAIFAIPILVYAIGLLELDGLLILLCHALTLVYIALGVVFSKAVFEAAEKSLHWFAMLLGGA